MEGNENELIRKLKAGSYEAFNTIYFDYSKRLYAFVKTYLKNDSDVEEIVQEVFLKLWKNRSDLNEDFSFDAYLFTISKNAILNTLRSKKYKNLYLDYIMSIPLRKDFMEEEINFRELNNAYKNTINALPPRKKEVFLLSREKFMSYKEISVALGISEKTVENHMSAALAEIRHKIRSLGFIGFLFFTNLK
ncbi:RNA polymerase sigma-70 factor [uncultured Draconibacterium sp.]|uniref:RNA polymerase sigma-70 factor n=1 Tax=uncultured Draconibacterium sp. TaxID=1573823 RepID=UPI003260DF0D